MDLSTTIEPRSDQLNFDDFHAGPKMVTVEKVTGGNAEQPVVIHLVEHPGRPYKPSMSMRRVLVEAWGTQGREYAGRAMMLYGDPTVKFGGIAVGGIKISHLSHIENPVTVNLTVARGKRAPHEVLPLKASKSALTDEQITACESTDELRDMWKHATPQQQELIKSRVAQLTETEESQS